MFGDIFGRIIIITLIILVPFLLKFIFTALDRPFLKFGGRKLTDEEVRKIKSTSFPFWFKYLNWLLYIATFVCMMSLFFVAFLKIASLQRIIFITPDTVFFNGIHLSFIIVSLFFFMMISFVSFLCLIPSYFPRLESYMYQTIFRRGFKEGIARLYWPKSTDYKIIISIIAIFLPFFFFYMHNFIRITDKELTVNPLFSIADHKYSWEEVESLRLYGFDTFNLEPYFDLTFKNKKKINLLAKRGMHFPGKDQVISLINKAKEKKVFVEVVRPRYEEVQYLNPKYKNNEKELRQRVFDIFDSAQKTLKGQ